MDAPDLHVTGPGSPGTVGRPDEAVVEFEDVSFGYPGHEPVLDRFSVSLAGGESLALVGASGAGKTTVLKLTNRLLAPASGIVRVQGRDTGDWDPIRLRRSIGYVIQEVGLFPHLTIEDNIAMLPRLEGWPAEAVAARIRELMELIGLDPQTYAQRWPSQLSSGQRQRVGVARALAIDPPVLLMDEPFGALDPITRRQLQEQFRSIQQRLHKGVILVTHDMLEALVLGDRIGVMHQGRLIWCGPAQSIVEAEDPHVRELVEAVTPRRRTAGPA